ncbi:MAG: hypothetical protein L0211_05865 [Planctomycetaceae bacterium]|nr:hypothetical protein [Planctomycetaceae bacterium]
MNLNSYAPTVTVRLDTLGEVVEVFQPRRWTKWLIIATFGPLGLAGLLVAAVIVGGIFTLPDVPLPLALPFAGIGLVLGCVGIWLVLRSWKWLGHSVEIREHGICCWWRREVEARRWEEIATMRAWSVEFKGRDYPHLSVTFRDGVTWHFDDEYLTWPRLFELIRRHDPSAAK